MFKLDLESGSVPASNNIMQKTGFQAFFLSEKGGKATHIVAFHRESTYYPGKGKNGLVGWDGGKVLSVRE